MPSLLSTFRQRIDSAKADDGPATPQGVWTDAPGVPECFARSEGG